MTAAARGGACVISGVPIMSIFPSADKAPEPKTKLSRRWEVAIVTHAATVDLLDDAVVGDSLPDHCAEMLGLELRRVNEHSEPWPAFP